MIYPCQRCKILFRNQEEVSSHLKEVKGCELREMEIGDGVTNEIVEQLKSKKKAHRDETEEDRWHKIYKLLFPECPGPSPCESRVLHSRRRKSSAKLHPEVLVLTNAIYIDFEQPSDVTELEDYEEYCRRELPRIVLATVEDIVNRGTEPLEDQLMRQLEQIIRHAQDQVYASYRSLSTPHSSSLASSEAVSTSTVQVSASVEADNFTGLHNVQPCPLMPPELPSRDYERFWMPSQGQAGSSSAQESNSTILPSPPRTSIEITESPIYGFHAGAFVDSQSTRVTSGNGLSKTIVGGEPSSSRNDPDWTIVYDPQERNNNFDNSLVDFEEGYYNNAGDWVYLGFAD